MSIPSSVTAKKVESDLNRMEGSINLIKSDVVIKMDMALQAAFEASVSELANALEYENHETNVVTYRWENIHWDVCEESAQWTANHRFIASVMAFVKAHCDPEDANDPELAFVRMGSDGKSEAYGAYESLCVSPEFVVLDSDRIAETAYEDAIKSIATDILDEVENDKSDWDFDLSNPDDVNFLIEDLASRCGEAFISELAEYAKRIAAKKLNLEQPEQDMPSMK